MEHRGSITSEQKHVSLLQVLNKAGSLHVVSKLLEHSDAAEGKTGLSFCPSCGLIKDFCPPANSYVSFLSNLFCIIQIFVNMSLQFNVDATGH